WGIIKASSVRAKIWASPGAITKVNTGRRPHRQCTTRCRKIANSTPPPIDHNIVVAPMVEIVGTVAPAWKSKSPGANLPTTDLARSHPQGYLCLTTCRDGQRPAAQWKNAMNYSTNFSSIKDQVSPLEWQARLDLAACYRLVDVYGMTDLIYNHITARVPGENDVVLLNLYGLLYKEITASSLVKIHVDGEIIWKTGTQFRIKK